MSQKQLLDNLKLEKGEHTLFGGILFGVEGRQIELQARFFGSSEEGTSWDIDITGMASTTIREVNARIAGAFAKYGLPPRKGTILINLAPAGLQKFGTSLDLPIAIIALQAAGHIPDFSADMEKTMFLMGELSLHGEIRRINGALPIALAAKPGSLVVVPAANEEECRLVRGLPEHGSTRIAVAENLEQVLLYYQGKGKLRDAMSDAPKYKGVVQPPIDFSSVKGQPRGKRAMLIAAAGGHNVLMIGPPGEGKTTLANALRGILPPLGQPEVIELTRIYSAKGLLTEDGMVVTQRPFRPIHHGASKQALVGGGSGTPEPGEITLAHRGILFLDEIGEFSKSTLESLRQPIEAGEIVVSRVDSSLTFPARFTLVAAMNPCPCGYFGQYICQDCFGFAYEQKAGCTRCGKFNLRQRCDCKPTKVQAYRKKISGPILDRIDLNVEIRPLSVDEKFSEEKQESTRVLRASVASAREIQRQRYGKNGVPYNAAIPAGEIQKWCSFSPEAFERYKRIIAEGTFTTRATDRMAKVARTVADLEGAEKIYAHHINEAAGFIGGSPLG